MQKPKDAGERKTSSDVSQSSGGIQIQKTRDIFISSVPTVPADTYYVSATVSQFIIDTGSPVSLLSSEIWKKLSLSTFQTLETWWKLMAHLALTLHEVNYIAHFIVVDMTVEGILGIDFMKKHHCDIDISNKSLFFLQEKISIPLFRSVLYTWPRQSSCRDVVRKKYWQSPMCLSQRES